LPIVGIEIADRVGTCNRNEADLMMRAYLKCANPVAALGLLAACLGITSIDPQNKFTWGENIGFMNWADADLGSMGVLHHGTYLSGFIWCENVGYVHVGGGGPYTNTDDTNYGVNVLGGGNLAGMAWGENIGWINFDTAAALGAFSQQARWDAAAGRFRGYAWGENVGWINLDDAGIYAGILAPALVSAASRKTHGGTEAFELDLPLTGPPGIESRLGGVMPRLVLTFNAPVAAIDGTLNCPSVRRTK
jgi:hypothetical protein